MPNLTTALDDLPTGEISYAIDFREGKSAQNMYAIASGEIEKLKAAYEKAGKVFHRHSVNFIDSKRYPHLVVSITTFNSEQEIVDEFFKEMEREQLASEMMRRKYAPTNSGLTVPRGNTIS